MNAPVTTDPVNIKPAMLKAADQIESRPYTFNFMAYRPADCGSPGCALGWISYFAKTPEDQAHRGALHLLGFPTTGNGAFKFYDAMSRINSGWKRSAVQCSSALRQYALTNLVGLGFAAFRAAALSALTVSKEQP